MSSVSGIKGMWNFDRLTPNDIKANAAELIHKIRDEYDQIAELNYENVSFESVIKRLADIECDYITYREPLEFPQYVVEDVQFKAAFVEASHMLEEFDVEISLRKDVYDKVVYFHDMCKSEMELLSPEFQRYIERIIKVGQRNGLHLPIELRNRIEDVHSRITELSRCYLRNLAHNDSILAFSEHELEGLTDDFIKNLDQTTTGKRIVTLKYPHFLPVIRRCKIPQTRFLINKGFDSICMRENVPILEELLYLRQEHAELLGYPNHAAFVLEMTMAKTPENVQNFLYGLQKEIQPLWEKERNLMLELKQKECEMSGMDFDETLNHWDVRYYMSMVNDTIYSIDPDEIREYFPLNVVIRGMFEIYKFLVTDSETEELMGYFIFDLFPRIGKFSNAAVFSLQPGCISPDGNRQVALSALLINLSPPCDGKPSLLDLEDVEMLFHEFGHIMHQICARAELAHFSGTNVERDFVEGPSQMLEKFVYEEGPLKMMSGHYLTGDQIPSDIIQKLISAQKANSGIYNLRQICLSILDLKIHSTGIVNTREFCEDIFMDVIGIPVIPGTNMAASFEHIVDEYDSQYYSYFWSEIHSADMFYTRFKRNGDIDFAAGREYRRCILEPGGTQDAIEMLKNFLGREPNYKAFLKTL